MRSLLARLAAAALVAAAAVVALPAGPAAASYCSDGGVSVLVDATALGSGSQQECGPGPKASTAFKDDFTLTGYRGDPTYVCQIEGLPADGDCRQTDAYWALFVSRGGGPWSYATQGAYTLDVADGDSVAFVWQDSASRRTPGAAPAAPAPTPTSAPTRTSPTKQPTEQPTKQPTRTPTRQPSPPTKAPTGSPSADPSSAATPTSGASPSAGATTSATAGETGSPGATDTSKSTQDDDATGPTPTSSPSASSTAPADEPSLVPAAEQGEGTSESEGVPAWLAVVALLLVGAGTGAVLIRRRRSSPGP